MPRYFSGALILFGVLTFAPQANASLDFTLNVG